MDRAIQQARAAVEGEPKVPSAAHEFRDYLLSKEVQGRLEDVASKYMKPDEVTRLVLVAVSRTPRILQCTRESILRCMMEAAVLGIRPGGILGRGWLIPRWNSRLKPKGGYELSFDPGWRGLADIARRSKVVQRIEARVVHERDLFEVIEGSEPRLEHRPYAGSEEPGAVRAAYAVAFFHQGERAMVHPGPQHEVLWKRDLDKIMLKSESKQRDDKGRVLLDPKTKQPIPIGPWAEWYDEMARKSAVRRLCKHLPANEELEYALEVATRAEQEEDDGPGFVVEAGAPRAKTLAERIRASQPQGEGEPEPPPSDPSMQVGDDPGDLAAG